MFNQDVTLIIKAFERSYAVVKLYESIRKFYPDLKIIIVDDSKNAMDASIFDKNVEYCHTDFDIGLSAGRNLAVSKVKTKYFVLLDDDFLFTKKTKLEKMYDALTTTGFKIVSGNVYDFGKKRRRFSGVFDKKDGYLLLMEDKDHGFYQGYKKIDFTINFFMAETQTILENKWDDKLKLCEHVEFFYRMTKNEVLITDLGKKVSIEHYPEAMGNYLEYRKRADGFRAMFNQEYGFKDYKMVVNEGLILRAYLALKGIPFIGSFVFNLKKKIMKV